MKPAIFLALTTLFACGALASEPDSKSSPAASESPAPPPLPPTLPKTVWPRIELSDGRVLEQARAKGADAISITFLHTQGITKVDRRLLPPELVAVFPFDAEAAGREARKQSEERVASAKAQAKVEEKAAKQARTAANRKASAPRASANDDLQAERNLRAITTEVKLQARQYFENEKRTGSGATLVFDLTTKLEDPEPVSGWTDRWEVRGVAGYKVYDSVGWGSFSARTKKFRALVECPAGKSPKIVSFDER